MKYGFVPLISLVCPPTTGGENDGGSPSGFPLKQGQKVVHKNAS